MDGCKLTRSDVNLIFAVLFYKFKLDTSKKLRNSVAECLFEMYCISSCEILD